MNKQLFLLFFLASLISLMSCEDRSHEALFLQSEQIITTVPSASGIVCKGENIWMIGDDVSSLFELDKNNEIKNSYQVSFMNRQENGRLLKSIKPDFESMDFFDDKLIMMGSGSKKISRDTAVIFDFKTREILAKASFRPLFNHFLVIGGFDSLQSINMEGITSDEKYFYLLHRGNICGKNIVFQIKKDELLTYIDEGKIPEVLFHYFDLPKIDGYFSGFSGACITPNQKYLLYTSSVESTNDVYHDGEVLGSFIGIIPMHGENAWQSNVSYPVLKNDSVLKTKLESICVKSQDGNRLNLVCVSDNDNGESGIYRILLDLEIVSND